MGKRAGATHFDRKPIYTLALNGTGLNTNTTVQSVLVSGEGTQLSNKKRLSSWSKKKLISQILVLKLADMAKEKGDMEQRQSYFNTFHCFNRIISFNERVYGKYCKNRFCPLCCGIRKAQMINNYLPVLKKWKDPFFLTLTAKAVDCENLEKRTDEMFTLLRQIISKHRKRFQRGKGAKFMGVHSFECNFNPVTQTYNPHFHLILPDLKTADTILVEWRKRGNLKWGANTVREAGQCNKRVGNMEKILIEILKYSSKIFTEPDLEKKEKANSIICVAAYYNIIEAMKDRHIFDRFGFDLPKRAKSIKKVQFVTAVKEWFYSSANSDWVEIEGEQTLTGYTPPPMLSSMLENNIDLKLK